MGSVWGVEHGEIAKFTSPREKWSGMSTRDRKTAGTAAAVGGAALGVKYGTGARALSRINPQRAAALGRSVRHAEGPDMASHMLNGDLLGGLARSAPHAYKQMGRNAVERDSIKRKAMAGAADWEKGPGMQRHRKLMNSKNPMRKLHPRYADHKVFAETVRNAPQANKTLHRAIRVNDRELASMKRGKKVNRGIQSWTSSEDMASMHGMLSGTKAGQRKLSPGGKSFEGRHNEVRLKMHRKGRALNIQDLGRMSQREYVSDKPYRIKAVVPEGPGVTTVHVRQRNGQGRMAAKGYKKRPLQRNRQGTGVQKNLSVWGVEHGVISKAERSNSDVARYRRTTPEQKDEMKRRGKRYANVANAAVLGSIGMGGKSIHHNLKSARLEGQANDALWGGHGDWRKAEALRARARVQGIKGAKSAVGMGALMAGAATTFFIGGQHNKYRLRRYPNTEA